MLLQKNIHPVEQLRDTILRFLGRRDPGVISLQRNQRNSCTCNICHNRHKTENHTKYALEGAETESDSNIYDKLFNRIQI